jgi:hypothetical protein
VETTECVPRHIIAIGKENSAISDDSKDYKYNKGEKTRACFEGSIVTSKLKKIGIIYIRTNIAVPPIAVIIKRISIVLHLKNFIRKTCQLVVVKMA